MSPFNTKTWLPCAVLVLASSISWAQTTAPGESSLPEATGGKLSLKEAFDTAWARQPEAQSLAARRNAATARRDAAGSWTADPMALELSTEGDQLNGDDGSREHMVGLSVPLWLPGERSRMSATADAEAQATASHASAAQLRIAGAVREAYWAWQRARVEQTLAGERLSKTQQLAADVAKRVRSGELAQADLHQANGAAALAEMEQASSTSAVASASQQLWALTGVRPANPVTTAAAEPDGEPQPPGARDFAVLERTHPALTALRDQSAVARSSAELAQVQTRANPELMLATTRERSRSGEPYDQTVSLGVRIPFGSSSRNRAKQATAQADAIEADVQLRLERERVLAELEATRLRLDAARSQAKAAEQRARLAEESRGFFDKSFRLGETDLPTRLRIELEATDARRQAALAHIDQAAATSALRQALGLLPE